MDTISWKVEAIPFHILIHEVTKDESRHSFLCAVRGLRRPYFRILLCAANARPSTLHVGCRQRAWTAIASVSPLPERSWYLPRFFPFEPVDR
jgi:hypothetical protein